MPEIVHVLNPNRAPLQCQSRRDFVKLERLSRLIMRVVFFLAEKYEDNHEDTK
jgi:hypothetical protein